MYGLRKFIVSCHLVLTLFSPYLRSVRLALSLAHCSDNCLFSGGARLLQPPGVGVAALLDGRLATMFLTVSSIFSRSTRELLKFSLDAAVDTLNCLRAASSWETGLDCVLVADGGILLPVGRGGLLLVIIGTDGVTASSSLLSLHIAWISKSSKEFSEAFLSTTD